MTPDGERERLYRRVVALEAEVERLQRILAQAGDIIITTDRDGLVTGFNEEAERLLGYTADEVRDRPASRFYVRRYQRQRLVERLARNDDGIVRADVEVKTKDGKRRWLGISLSVLRDEAGAPVGTIGVGKDVTKRRRLEDKLRRLSITDALTGLYNQSHFFHRLEVEKERAVRLGHRLSLLLFDLDGFKSVNDTIGHSEGDQILRAIGRILFETIRKEVDSAFRYGGDEFTVLLPGADATTAASFADRVRLKVVRCGLHGVTTSMGICQFDPAQRSIPLVEKADVAMYSAKRSGGNAIAVHDPARDEPRLVTRV